MLLAAITFSLWLLDLQDHGGLALPLSTNQTATYHALIIDAGSTGTRANYYSFKANEAAPLGLQISGFRTQKVRPGLSTFVGDDVGAEANILKLIAKVSPVAKNSDLELQATAGMRIAEMKDKEAAQHLMEILRRMLRESYGGSMHICEKCVKISSGEEEGLYAYIAVNYMLGNLGRPNASMVGIIEIGGASMQIVLPESSSTQTACSRNISSSLQDLLKHQCAHSKSFLPFGMEMVRHAFFQVPRACVITACSRDKAIHYSPCLHSEFKQNSSIGATDITIAGQEAVTKEERFTKCYASIASYLKNQLRLQEKAIPKQVENGWISQPIYLMGGAITKTLNELGYNYHTPLSVQDIDSYANKACLNLISTGYFEPFNCMNLVYLAAALKEAFGFNEKQVFIAAEAVGKIELEWALGAALEAVSHHANLL